MGSFWDDWTPDNWNTVTTGLGNAVGAVANVADKVVPDARKTKVAGGYSGIPATTTDDGANPAGAVFGAYMNVVTAPVKVAAKALDTGYQYGINRPISTLIQAVGPNNPLYADGFTFDDYVRMWNASEYINMGNAAGMTIAGTGIGADWAPDWAKPAYGSSRDMQRSPFNFYIPENLGFERSFAENPDGPGYVPSTEYVPSFAGDSTLYNISSGMIDQGIATVATAGVDKLAKVAKVGMGLNTVIDSTRDMAALRESMASGILHAKTAGAEGKWSVGAAHVLDIAKADSAASIYNNPLLKNSPNRLELSDLLAGVTEPETVARVIMADKGDRYAIASLVRENPNLTWRMNRMTERLQKQIAETGEIPLLDKKSAAAVDATFTAEINRQPSAFYKDLFELFLAPETDEAGKTVSGLLDGIRVSDRTQPMSGVAGRIAIAARNAPDRLSQGDGWVAHTFSAVSSSAPVTVGIEWLGGRMPKGSIQLSQATPTEIVDEMLAGVGRIPFTRGTREWEFVRDGAPVRMNGRTWREDMINRVAAASNLGDQALQDAIMQSEHELITSVVRKFGLTQDEAEGISRTIMQNKSANIQQVKDVGFWFDASGNRIMTQPAFRRQLVDTYTMFPLEDFLREARRTMLSKQGKRGRNALYTTRHNVDRVYDVIQKYVRTEQLVKLAYTPKNAIAEPMTSTILNEGLANAPQMLGDLVVGTGRYLANRGRQAKGIAAKPGEYLANRELNDLHLEYQKLLIEQDDIAMAQQALLDPSISPASRARKMPIFDAQAKQVSRELMDLKREMGMSTNDVAPFIDQPTYFNVRGEARSLVDVLDNPASVEALRSEIEYARASEIASYATRRETAAVKYDANQARIEELDALLAMNNDDLIASRDVTASVNNKLQSLRIAERKLAGAKRALAEGPPDLNAASRRGLQRTLDDLMEQRKLAEAVQTTAQAELDMPLGRMRKTDQLADIDQQIESVQRSLQTLSEIPGRLPFKYQEIADTYPQLIADLRAELGDNAPAVDTITQDLTDGIEQAQSLINKLRASTSKQVSQLKAERPKTEVDAETGELKYVATAQEEAEATAHAESIIRARHEELDLTDLPVIPTDPAFGVPMSTIDLNRFLATGEVRFSWLQKVWENLRATNIGSEELELWLRTGFLDPEDATAAGRNFDWGDMGRNISSLGDLRAFVNKSISTKPGSKPTGTLDEIAEISSDTTTNERLTYLARNRQFSPEQVGTLKFQIKARGLNVTPFQPRKSQNIDLVRFDWYRGTRQVADEVADEKAAYLADLIDYRIQTAREIDDQVNDVLGIAAEELEGHRSFIAELKTDLADYKSGKPINRDFGSVIDNPMPGPYELRKVKMERDKLAKENVGHDKVMTQEHQLTPQLQGKIQQLEIAEKLLGADPKVQKQIRDLLEDVQKLANQRVAVNKASVTHRTIEEVEAELADVAAKIGAKRDATLARRARTEASRERSMTGQTDRTITLPSGETMTAPGLFAADNFGSARKADFSASHTNKVTIDPSQRGMGAVNRVGMVHETVTVLPTDPRYFDELVYVANRHITGDDLATRLLDGDSDASIMSWLSEAGGLRYMEDMGWDASDLRGNAGKVNQARLLINQYLPTEEARSIVRAGEVTPIQMEKALQGIPVEQLSPVQGGALEQITTGNALGGWMRKAGDKLWASLATKPENLFRFPFATRAMDRELTARLSLLEQQGIKVSPSDLHATYNAAAQAVLTDARKTFYNIIRYSNPVYATRYFLTYPGAYFNTMYRMARLTAKNPGTAAYLSSTWQGFFTQHGVDEEGNRTDDYTKVKYLVIDLPESFSKLGVSPQLKWNAKSFELTSDRVGASWPVQLPIATLLANRPDLTDTVKAILGPTYETVFPLGEPSGLTDYMLGPIPIGGLIPGYAKSANNVIQQVFRDVDTEPWTRVAGTILQHDAARWDFLNSHPEFGMDPGPKPTIEEVANKATFYWVFTGLGQFAMVGGSGLQPAGQIEKDKINQIVQKYNGDREAALPEVLQTFPNLDAKDMMASTSAYRAFIPSTVEAYKMVTDPALKNVMVTVTADQGDGDPEMVSLLVADKVGEFSPNIYDALGNLTLPGDTTTNRTKLPLELINARMDASDSWDQFNSMKTMVMAEVQRRGLKSMPQDLRDQWNPWLKAFSKDPKNATWLAQYSRTDRATATKAINALELGLVSPEMKNYRDTQYWKSISAYLDLLPAVQQKFSSYKGDTTAQDELKSVWDVWVNQAFGAIDPIFMSAYNKYLAGYDLEAG